MSQWAEQVSWEPARRANSHRHSNWRVIGRMTMYVNINIIMSEWGNSNIIKNGRVQILLRMGEFKWESKAYIGQSLKATQQPKEADLFLIHFRS